MRITGLFMAAALGALACPAMAQQTPPPPLAVVKDMPPSAGYGSNPPDVLGIHFGDSIADAQALLRAACGGNDPDERIFDERVNDNRGNEVDYAYDYESSCRVDGPPSDAVQVYYTTGSTGPRVFEIKRQVDYPEGGYASMAEVKKAIIDKYGKPTVTLLWPHQDRDELYYTWEQGGVSDLGTVDMSKQGFTGGDPADTDRCLSVAGVSAYFSASSAMYAVWPAGTRKAEVGRERCIGAIRFTIFYGNSEQTVAGLRVEATDYARSLKDAQTTDALLAKMMAAKASVPGQGAPKL